MAANALVQTRVDSEVKKKAISVLSSMGLTVSDAVRILLTRTANEGVLPFILGTEAKEHDAWFRARVQEALDDRRTPLAHEDVEAHFAMRREAALKKAGKVDG